MTSPDDFARIDQFLSGIRQQRDANIKSTLISQGAIWGGLLAFSNWRNSRQAAQQVAPQFDVKQAMNEMAQMVTNAAAQDGLKISVTFPVALAIGDTQVRAIATILDGPDKGHTHSIVFTALPDNQVSWQWETLPGASQPDAPQPFDIQQLLDEMAQAVANTFWLNDGLKISVTFPVAPELGDTQGEAIATITEGTRSGQTFPVRFVFTGAKKYQWRADSDETS